MSQTLIAGLKASALDFHAAGEAMINGAVRLEALADALEREMAGIADPDTPVSYKKPNGRFTEAGQKAVLAALSSGMSVTQVAKQFDVHPSAITPKLKALREAQAKAGQKAGER